MAIAVESSSQSKAEAQAQAEKLLIKEVYVWEWKKASNFLTLLVNNITTFQSCKKCKPCTSPVRFSVYEFLGLKCLFKLILIPVSTAY